jgi:hypothetical protein
VAGFQTFLSGRFSTFGDIDLPIPNDEIPDGDETACLHRWGYRRYREMFTCHHNDPFAYLPIVVAVLDAQTDCMATLPSCG